MKSEGRGQGDKSCGFEEAVGKLKKRATGTMLPTMLPALLAVFLGLNSGQNARPPDTSPHKSSFVIANGVRLEVLDWGGKGDAIIFLAGSGDNPHAFDELAPRFAKRFRVYGLTRRGFGRSQRNVTGFDAKTLCRDLESFMNMAGIERAHLVGHSAAGDELTQFALSYPDRVLKLVYLDAAYNRSEIVELDKLDPIPEPPPTNPRLLEYYKAMEAFRPNFAAINAPMLSIYAIFEKHWSVDEKTPPELAKKAQDFMEQNVQPYQWRNIRAFRCAAPEAEVEVLRGTDHYFFQDPKRKDWTFLRMSRFLAKPTCIASCR